MVWLVIIIINYKFIAATDNILSRLGKKKYKTVNSDMSRYRDKINYKCQ